MTDLISIDTMASDNKFSVVIPSDDEYFYERPFFAYGIFKEGQLCFPSIADCVEDVFPDEICRKMHIRDGVPVILNEHSTFKTKGHRIHSMNGLKMPIKKSAPISLETYTHGT